MTSEPVTRLPVKQPGQTLAHRRDDLVAQLRRVDEEQLAEAMALFARAEEAARLVSESPTQPPGACDAGRRLAEAINTHTRAIIANHGRFTQ